MKKHHKHAARLHIQKSIYQNCPQQMFFPANRLIKELENHFADEQCKNKTNTNPTQDLVSLFTEEFI
jgi:hypothetical protein